MILPGGSGNALPAGNMIKDGETKPENIHALVDLPKEYGIFKKIGTVESGGKGREGS